jgi:hypothetical protein
MGIKVTKRITFDKKIRKAVRTIGQGAPRRKIRSLVLAEIRRGKSPVKDGRWDKPYSQSYQDAIRAGRVPPKFSTSPVNLRVSGELHRSLESIVIKNGIKLQFSDPIISDGRRASNFHDKLGAGKAKAIRRLLPRGKEVFIDDIMKTFKNFLRQKIRNATR